MISLHIVTNGILDTITKLENSTEAILLSPNLLTIYQRLHVDTKNMYIYIYVCLKSYI